MDTRINALLDKVDGLLALHQKTQHDKRIIPPESVAVFSPSAARKVGRSAVTSQSHSHIAPPIL